MEKDNLVLNEQAQNIIKTKLQSLKKSKFRSRFHLTKKEITLINEKGLSKIKEHAYDIIKKNLAIYDEKKDGKQTPMKNHPVFIAEHATATCCRGCLEKWHKISKTRPLRQNEINFIVELIMAWIKEEYKNN